MAKFKVGDKVRIVFGDGFIEWVSDMRKFIGKTVTISEVSEDSKHPWFRIAGHYFHWNECDAELIEQPRREFIVIRRDGAKTIAELRHDREIIKSGTAICNASDTFDFQTGAKLAFDRLMGRDEPKPEPKPAHRFKVGDRVLHEEYGLGTIIGYLDFVPSVPYLVKPDNGNCFMNHWAEAAVSPAPAPEPPKFYTGKVVMVDCEFPDRKHLINHLFEFKDGRQVGNKMHGMSFDYAPYTSFGQIALAHNASTWIEVEE